MFHVHCATLLLFSKWLLSFLRTNNLFTILSSHAQKYDRSCCWQVGFPALIFGVWALWSDLCDTSPNKTKFMLQNLVVSDEQIPHHFTMLQKIDRFRWVNITSGDFCIDSPPVCHALSILKMYFTKRHCLIGNVFLHLVTNTILNTVLSTSI